MRPLTTRIAVALLMSSSLVTMGTGVLSGQATAEAVASTGEPRAIQQIQQVIDDYVRAVDLLDLDLARKIWSSGPEASFIHPRGTERGIEQILANFYLNTMGTFSERQLLASKPGIHVYGDMAWSEFTWTFHATVKNGGQKVSTTGRETQVYHKENGSWHIVLVHYSGMPVAEPSKGL